MEPGSSHLSGEQVIAEVIASVMLKPVGSQALFLVLLRGMGRRYTGAGQGALPHSAVSPEMAALVLMGNGARWMTLPLQFSAGIS